MKNSVPPVTPKKKSIHFYVSYPTADLIGKASAVSGLPVSHIARDALMIAAAQIVAKSK